MKSSSSRSGSIRSGGRQQTESSQTILKDIRKYTQYIANKLTSQIDTSSGIHLVPCGSLSCTLVCSIHLFALVGWMFSHCSHFPYSHAASIFPILFCCCLLCIATLCNGLLQCFALHPHFLCDSVKEMCDISNLVDCLRMRTCADFFCVLALHDFNGVSIESVAFRCVRVFVYFCVCS